MGERAPIVIKGSDRQGNSEFTARLHETGAQHPQPKSSMSGLWGNKELRLPNFLIYILDRMQQEL
jgi:hypothetical protein